MTRNVPSILVALLLVVIILLMMCAFQVRYTETVVVTRFDKIKDVFTPDEAGFQWKLPWPVDQVHRFDARLRTFETEFKQLGTADQKTVVLTSYATWRIADAEKFLKAIGREDAAVPKIRDLLEDRVSEVLKSHGLSELVNADPKQMKFSEIEAAFLTGIKGPARDRYGVDINSVGIKRLGIPESVTKEVFARMKADREKTIKTLTAEGNAEAARIRSDAGEVKEKIIARAQAYAETIKARGDAEAAKYNKFFAENRELSDFLMRRESLLRIFESGQLTLVLPATEIQPFNELIKSMHWSSPKTAGSGSKRSIAPDSMQPSEDEALSSAGPSILKGANVPVRTTPDDLGDEE